MIKSQELSDPNSCLNKAKDDEMIFVLLGRDESAIDAVNEWIESRIRRGLNLRSDPKIISAYEWMGKAIANREKKVT